MPRHYCESDYAGYQPRGSLKKYISSNNRILRWLEYEQQNEAPMDTKE